MELHRRDTGCIEVILHPLLRTLEVTSRNLLLVLDHGHNLGRISIIYLFFDVKRQSGLEQQLLSFIGSLR